jgi:glycosyltransferase involved in cell wall biosynthesis
VGLTSVVIPARNAAAVLPVQLEALAEQDYPGEWEVLVVDHRSSDGTAAAVEPFADRVPVRVVRSDRRGAANTARNDGAHAARGDLLVFCDADDVVAAGWLSAMVRAAAHADIVGGTLDIEQLNPAAVRWWRGDARGAIAAVDDARFGFLPYAPAGNIAVRADVFGLLGGFAEEYRHGCDEMALVWRAQRAGYRLAAASDAVVHYRFRDRVGAMAWQHFRYARMEPKLYREFRPHGMPRASTRSASARWWSVLRSAPDIVRGVERRGQWMRTAALSAGRAWGSIVNRVVYL